MAEARKKLTVSGWGLPSRHDELLLLRQLLGERGRYSLAWRAEHVSEYVSGKGLIPDIW